MSEDEPVTVREGEGRAVVPRRSPQQLVWRDRVEGLIGFAAPALDLVLATGDRLSKLLGPEDYDYYPVRAPGESIDLGLEPDSAARGDAPVE